MKRKIDHFISGILIVLLCIMVLAVLWQVFSRFILNAPSSFSEELARYCLVWIGILGAAYAAGQRLHLAITLFPDSLQAKNRMWLQLFLNILIILFAITAFIIGGCRLVYITSALGQSSPALDIPLAWVYSVLPLSGFIILVYKALEIAEIKKSLYAD
jgi:TRAP-type C4-dicarboxylate transport system permease small subunit